MKAADKRRYERLKAEKRCVRCGAQDERTKAGRTLCNGCYVYDSKKLGCDTKSGEKINAAFSAAYKTATR